MPDFDLLEVGKGCYTSALLSYNTRQVHHRRQTGAPSTVTFGAIRLLPNSFVGPDSILLSGVTVESDAAISERTLVAPHTTVETGTAMLGTRGKLIRYRPDRSRAPAGGVLAYEVHMLLLMAVRIAWHLSFTVAAPLAIWYEQARATGLLDRGADMGTFVMFSTITICTACVIQPLFVQPLYAVCSVLFSRSLMGSLAQPGKAYGVRLAHEGAFALDQRVGTQRENGHLSNNANSSTMDRHVFPAHSLPTSGGHRRTALRGSWS